VTREVAAINVGQGRSAPYRRTDLCQRKLSAHTLAIGDDRPEVRLKMLGQCQTVCL